jgi:hypothetical protein
MHNNICNSDLAASENQLVKESLIYLKSFIEDMGEFYPFAKECYRNEIYGC